MGTAASRRRSDEADRSAGRSRRRRWLGAGLPLAAVGILAIALGPLGWRLPTSPVASSTDPSAGAATATAAGSAAASDPALEFEPVSLEGQGDGRVAFDIPAGAAALARVSNRGSGPFHVQTLAAQDAPGQVLVDTAGDYDGLLLFDALVDQHSAAFDVRSSGTWTILVEPVGLAPAWSGQVPLMGSGDDVALLDATADGTTGVRIQHLGQGPITVLAYTANGNLDQLADVVGPLNETDVLPAGTICLQVRGVGRWSLSPG